ncbi:MAG: glycosyltransferase family 4 protein [Bryobacteraceae bacterium]|nr:glycosyltransferase family 4 protein [Bryobacteraceae bacterium]
MNVLFVDQYSEMGGAQFCLLDVLAGARQRGWRCFAALPRNGPLIGRLAEGGVPVQSIPCGPYAYGRKSPADFARFLLDTPRAAMRLRRMVAACSIDLVYANGPRVLPAASLSGAPLLFHAHSVLSRTPERWLVKRATRRATVLAASQFVAQSLRGICAPHIVPNGTEDLGYRPWGASPPLRVGVIGRIAPEKGQREFVEAVRMLARPESACRFVICGQAVLADPAYADEVRRQAAGLPIEFTSRETPAEALRTVDILVVPSGPNEAFSRVVVEAFSAGVPVVAFAAGAIPELITHGRTGFLVSEPSASSLAGCLRELLDAPGRLAPVASAARDLWEQRYTVERYRDQVLALMEEAVLRSRNQNNRPANTATAPAGISKAG